MVVEVEVEVVIEFFVVDFCFPPVIARCRPLRSPNCCRWRPSLQSTCWLCFLNFWVRPPEIECEIEWAAGHSVGADWTVGFESVSEKLIASVLKRHSLFISSLPPAHLAVSSLQLPVWPNCHWAFDFGVPFWLFGLLLPQLSTYFEFQPATCSETGPCLTLGSYLLTVVVVVVVVVVAVVLPVVSSLFPLITVRCRPLRFTNYPKWYPFLRSAWPRCSSNLPLLLPAVNCAVGIESVGYLIDQAWWTSNQLSHWVLVFSMHLVRLPISSLHFRVWQPAQRAYDFRLPISSLHFRV